MSEELNLSALGPHFDKALAGHKERHKQATAEDRRQRLAQIKERLSGLSQSPEMAGREQTGTYVVQVLKTGTKVGASLSTNEDILTHKKQTLGEALDGMLEKSGERYVGLGKRATSHGDGPLTQREIDEEQDALILHAALETTEGTQTTTDSVFVGLLVNPDVIYVPDEAAAQEHNLDIAYMPIGPDDSRYEPILSMMELVARKAGQEVSQYSPEN